MNNEQLLKEYNCWRRGDPGYEMPNPTEIGIAIDSVIAQLAALKEENERLAARVADQSAYILRLRKAIIDATNNAVPLDSGKWVFAIDDSVLQWPEALKEPANEG